MELRQLKYFVRVVELGSMGKAARELGVVTSALSQQISRLESELSTRLLQRTSQGVFPTEAGLAFWRQAQLAIRHAEHAALAARDARLTGRVSVGLSPTTASLLARPFFNAMRERYPDIRLHLVETLSGHSYTMLHRRQLDLAVLFNVDNPLNWSVTPILDETLFLLVCPGLLNVPDGEPIHLEQAAELPLAMTTAVHDLRRLTDEAYARAGVEPRIAIEVDGLSTLMDLVIDAKLATVQPGAAVHRTYAAALHRHPIADPELFRRNMIVSVSDDELAPAALAARVVLADVMRQLVRESQWPGATLHD